MRAQISVVIPTLNAAPALPGCLATLMEGVSAGLIRELVVSDGGSTDATVQIAQDAGARVVCGAASRGGQLRRGIGEVHGGWLLALHADSYLAPGWSETVQAHITARNGPACFRLAFDETRLMALWVAGWANLRTRLFRLPYGDQGLLIRREDYDRAGGYPDQPLMEDVALVRALNHPVTLLAARVVTSARRYRRDGWLRRGAGNLFTLGRYLAGADPADLAKSYESRR